MKKKIRFFITHVARLAEGQLKVHPGPRQTEGKGKHFEVILRYGSTNWLLDCPVLPHKHSSKHIIAPSLVLCGRGTFVQVVPEPCPRRGGVEKR